MTLQEMQTTLAVRAELARTSQDPVEVDAALNDVEKLQVDIRRAERVLALSKPQPKTSGPGIQPVVKPMTEDEKLDQFIAAVPFPGRFERLYGTAGDIQQEAQNGDGGYLLPIDKRELLKLLMPVNMVASMCDTLYTPSNATTVPVDEDAPWSANLDAGDVTEGSALVEEKVTFGLRTATLVKAGALCRVSREMLEDSTGIGQYITTKLGDKLSWRLHARCLAAFFASPAKITIAGDATSRSAIAGPPTLAGMQAMWVRMLAPHRDRAVWLANPTLETVFQNFVIGQYPVYVNGSLANGAFPTLFGRPVYYVEGMPALGAAGDVQLVAPQQFWQVLKTTGARIEESIHAEFKYDVVQYRAYIRSVCISKFSAPITRADTTTAGNVVAIANRTA